MEVREKIIKIIRENRISTTEVADVLGKKGHVKGPMPIIPGLHKVGFVEFVYAWNESNWEVHEQLQNISEDRIVYIHGIQCEERAIFGDLVSKYILLYKRASAIIVNGLLRDAHTLIKEKYPMWCTGFTPIGCFNTKNETMPPKEMLEMLYSTFQGAVIVADDSGVILIEKEFLTEDLIKKLEFIELQEDVWYFCMDAHKMSTFEIVCQKKYLSVDGLISKDKLNELSTFSTAG